MAQLREGWGVGCGGNPRVCSSLIGVVLGVEAEGYMDETDTVSCGDIGWREADSVA